MADFFFIFPLFLAAAFRPYCNLSSCFSSSPNRKNVERAWTSFSTAGVIPNLPEIMYGGGGGGGGGLGEGRFGLKTGICFTHFGLESGLVFEGTTGVYESIYHFHSKRVRKKEKYVNLN